MYYYKMFFVIIASLVCSDIYADFKILKVSKSKKRVKVQNQSGDESLSVGDVLSYSNDFDESCGIPIIKVKKRYAIGDITKCSLRLDLRRGQELSMDDEFEEDFDELEDDDPRKKARWKKTLRDDHFIVGVLFNTQGDFDVKGTLDISSQASFSSDPTSLGSYASRGKYKASGGMGFFVRQA